jgi:hypothetical protein
MGIGDFSSTLGEALACTAWAPSRWRGWLGGDNTQVGDASGDRDTEYNAISRNDGCHGFGDLGTACGRDGETWSGWDGPHAGTG